MDENRRDTCIWLGILLIWFIVLFLFGDTIQSMLVLINEYTIGEYRSLFLFGGYFGLGIFILFGSIRSIYFLIQEDQRIGHIGKTTIKKEVKMYLEG